MMTVQEKDRYNTSLGLALLVDNNQKFSIGDKITTSEGLFIIKSIQMPTTPNVSDIMLIVEKGNNIKA